MVALMDLWLPIVLSAAAVWFASALAWMALPHHRGDFKQLPDEDGVMATVKRMGIAPGLYFFPHMKDCGKMKNDPVAKAKFEQGPHGTLQVWPADAFGKMGRNMALSFIFYVIVSTTIAYLATMAISTDAEFMRVFRFTGTAAIMAYCFASIPNAIWFGTPGRNMAAAFVDGVAYGLITGAIFAWLWPAAELASISAPALSAG